MDHHTSSMVSNNTNGWNTYLAAKTETHWTYNKIMVPRMYITRDCSIWQCYCIKDETQQARVWASGRLGVFLYYAKFPIMWLWLFAYALDSWDWTLTLIRALIIDERFMGHLEKPACPLGKSSNQCQVLRAAMSLKSLLIIEKTCDRPMLYNLACKNIQHY